VFVLTIAAVSVYSIITWNQRVALKEKGVHSIAIISKIRHESYRVNELDVRTVDHYYISYTYKVNHKWLHGLSELSRSEYSDYFDERVKVGDTIKVNYIESSPSNVELVKK
jgi:hypothetical protein